MYISVTAGKKEGGMPIPIWHVIGFAWKYRKEIRGVILFGKRKLKERIQKTMNEVNVSRLACELGEPEDKVRDALNQKPSYDLVPATVALMDLDDLTTIAGRLSVTPGKLEEALKEVGLRVTRVIEIPREPVARKAMTMEDKFRYWIFALVIIGAIAIGTTYLARTYSDLWILVVILAIGLYNAYMIYQRRNSRRPS